MNLYVLISLTSFMVTNSIFTSSSLICNSLMFNCVPFGWIVFSKHFANVFLFTVSCPFLLVVIVLWVSQWFPSNLLFNCFKYLMIDFLCFEFLSSVVEQIDLIHLVCCHFFLDSLFIFIRNSTISLQSWLQSSSISFSILPYSLLFLPNSKHSFCLADLFFSYRPTHLTLCALIICIIAGFTQTSAIFSLVPLLYYPCAFFFRHNFFVRFFFPKFRAS